MPCLPLIHDGVKHAKAGIMVTDLRHAGIRGGPDWTMKREMLSPRYTTHWDELPPVKGP